MFRRFRLLLPPSFVMGGFLFLAAFLGFCAYWLPAPVSLRYFAALTVGFTVVYAGYRGLRFHPAMNPGYRAWLALSPWDYRHPLPLGPVLPCWGDLLIVSGLALVVEGLLRPLNPSVPPVALVLGPAVFAYVSTLMGALRRGTHGWPWNHVTLDCLLVATSLWPWPWLALGALVLALAAACWGARRTLRTFRDWPDDMLPPIRLDTQIESLSQKPGDLGWPWNKLGPLPHPKPGEALTWADHLLLSFTPALAVLAFLRFPRDDNFGAGLACLLPLGLVILFRLVIYTSGYRAPISVAGRFRIHGGLIRGYDQVFVGPLMAVLAMLVVPGALLRLGTPIPFAFATAVFVSLYFTFASKPSLYDWRLTGRHRIASEFTEAQKDYVQTG